MIHPDTHVCKKSVHHVHSADAQTDLGKHILQKHTVFDLITTHTPISAQLSNSVVFRLQQVCFLTTSL